MSLELSRPEKELWDGVDKHDLARHMETVAPQMLPHAAGRPLSLVRAPDGIARHRFFQKHARHLGRDLDTCVFDDVDYVLVHSSDDLVRLADQATVELHGWTSRCDMPESPDRIVFDLDPPDAEGFPDMQDIARELCAMLERHGAAPFPLLTGSKGIHVVVPIERGPEYPDVQAFTDAVANVMVRGDDRLTVQVRKDKRKGRIFFDTLRNRPRQTSVLPWSPRARAGAPFALPVAVDDLEDDLDPRQGRIGEAGRWLARDAWSGFFDAAVPLEQLM